MATIHASITPQDIGRGRQFDCCHCPAAIAATRALRDHDVDLSAEAAYVGITIYSTNRFRRWTVATPAKLSIWMRDFDLGKNVQPIEFDMEIPEGVIVQ